MKPRTRAPAKKAARKPAKGKAPAAKPKAKPKAKAPVSREAEEFASTEKQDGGGQGGRPPKYKAEYAKQATKIAQLGATDREIAEFFDVTDRTLRAWKLRYPGFAAALKLGKDEADDRVERALYQRAVGYSFDSVKVMQYEGVPVIVPVTEHMAPDIQAAMYFLNNRRGYKWKSKVEHQVDITDNLADALKAARERAKQTRKPPA